MIFKMEKMKNRIFLSVAIGVLVVCIYINTSYIPISSLRLRNIEALAQVESTVCPDYNYVPDVSIHAEEIRTNVECSTNGEISVGGEKIKGSYKRGKSYEILYEKKNCDQPAKGACCDQRQVGIRLVN